MDIISTSREFGVKLAAGQTSSPGTLINVDSSGTGIVGSDTSSYHAHGIALTSGAGTKATGISQYINCYRSAQVYNSDIAYTIGGIVYLGENGGYTQASGGTLNQPVGFALKADTIFVDLDATGLTTT